MTSNTLPAHRVYRNKLRALNDQQRKYNFLEYERNELQNMMEENEIVNQHRDNELYEKTRQHLIMMLDKNIKEVKALTERVVAV